MEGVTILTQSCLFPQWVTHKHAPNNREPNLCSMQSTWLHTFMLALSVVDDRISARLEPPLEADGALPHRKPTEQEACSTLKYRVGARTAPPALSLGLHLRSACRGFAP